MIPNPRFSYSGTAKPFRHFHPSVVSQLKAGKNPWTGGTPFLQSQKVKVPNQKTSETRQYILSIFNGPAVLVHEEALDELEMKYPLLTDLVKQIPTVEEFLSLGFNDFETNFILRNVKEIGKLEENKLMNASQKSSIKLSDCVLDTSGPKPVAIVWLWQGLDLSWLALDKQTSINIERAIQTGVKILNVESPFRKTHLAIKRSESSLDKKKKPSVSSHWCIDLSTMTLKLVSSSTELTFNIRRAKKKFFTDILMDYENLCQIAFQGDEQKFFSLITKFTEKDLKLLRSSREQTVLYSVCVGGKSLKILTWLIHNNMPLSSKQGPKGSTPLHAASWEGHPEFVALLLDAGADPQIKNDLGWTAVVEAQLAVKPIFQAFKDNKKTGLLPYLPKISATYKIYNLRIIELPNRPIMSPGEEIFVHVSSFDTATNQPLGYWSFQWEDRGDWEISVNQVVANVSCKINLNIKIELTYRTQIGMIEKVKIGDTWLSLGLLKEQVVSKLERQLKGDNSKKAAKVSLSISLQPLYENQLEDFINIEWQNPTGFSKKLFQTFYNRVHAFFLQYQETIANTNEKMTSTLSKIYATAVSKKKEKCFVIEESKGPLHPRVILSDFATPFENMTITQTFYHLLGSGLYLRNLRDVFVNFKTQRLLYTENWEFSDFVSEYVLDQRFEAFLDVLTRQPVPTLEHMMNAVARYVQRYRKFPEV
jgi:hypothetical protein